VTIVGELGGSSQVPRWYGRREVLLTYRTMGIYALCQARNSPVGTEPLGSRLPQLGNYLDRMFFLRYSSRMLKFQKCGMWWWTSTVLRRIIALRVRWNLKQRKERIRNR